MDKEEACIKGMQNIRSYLYGANSRVTFGLDAQQKKEIDVLK